MRRTKLDFAPDLENSQLLTIFSKRKYGQLSLVLVMASFNEKEITIPDGSGKLLEHLSVELLELVEIVELVER